MTNALTYADVLARKAVVARPRGMENLPELNPNLFGHQRAVTEFLLHAGCGAGFLDTGLGKALIQLEWGRVVAEHTNKPVLGFTPLAVGPQHVREAARFGVDGVRVVRSPDELQPGVNLVNYEKLHLFSPEDLGGVFLDESSILKSFSGITTRRLIAFGAGLDWRSAFTATPAPNDHTELGQHSQFLGIMASNEMLMRWFQNDSSRAGVWRLKKYGVESFRHWMASWSRWASKPSDLGPYSNAGYDLPGLEIVEHLVRVDVGAHAGEEKAGQLRLMRAPSTSATDLHKERRLTAEARAKVIAEPIMDDRDEPWVVWVDTDYEADAIMERLEGAVEVRGSMSPEVKEERLDAFGQGLVRILVTKPRIAGYGLNWQHCARNAFPGVGFSYEQWYQAVRRTYRFGQTRPVQVHMAYAETETAPREAIARKAAEHEAMKTAMAAVMCQAAEHRSVKLEYAPQIAPALPAWLCGALT